MNQATVQFILFLVMALLVALIIWGAVRNRAREQTLIDDRRSLERVRREIMQIELHRPDHIVKGDNE